MRDVGERELGRRKEDDPVPLPGRRRLWPKQLIINEVVGAQKPPRQKKGKVYPGLFDHERDNDGRQTKGHQKENDEGMKISGKKEEKICLEKAGSVAEGEVKQIDTQHKDCEHFKIGSGPEKKRVIENNLNEGEMDQKKKENHFFVEESF